jgi:alpha-tubulin suppressor-like RCC1 family protein
VRGTDESGEENKAMKKIVGIRRRALATAVLAAFGMAGCGGSNNGDKELWGYMVALSGGLLALGGEPAVVGPGVPAPGAFTASAEPSGLGTVQVIWTASPGATEYTLTRAISADGPFSVLSIQLTALSYGDGGVWPGTTYFYKLRAFNGGSHYYDSNVAFATARDPLVAPPAAVGSLTANLSMGMVSLDWTAASGANSYIVLRSTTPGSGFAPIATGLTTLSFVDATVQRGWTYYYVVAAVNDGGAGPNSNEVSAPIAPRVPWYVATRGGDGVIRLTWLPPYGATSYSIRRSPWAEGPYTTIVSGLSASSYEDHGLEKGTAYYYVLRASNAGSESEDTNPVFGMPVRIVRISAGGDHSMALDDQGDVWTWGSNQYGQLGDGTKTDSWLPHRLSTVSDAKDIAAGAMHSVVLRNDGTVLVWGGNALHQLGINGADSTIPTPVSNLSGATAIYAGFSHSLALLSDGSVKGWGSNGFGELGNGTTIESSGAVGVLNLTEAAVLAVGDGFSLALRRDGTVWAWGRNDSGMLGNGTAINSATPVQVNRLSGVRAIGAGWSHALAAKSDGTVWAWGSNVSGQLGNGGTANQSLPVQAVGVTAAVGILGGSSHSLALLADGTVRAWGGNSAGELGIGSYESSATSLPVANLTGVSALAAGEKRSLVLQPDGTMWAWGSNGRNGLGTTVEYIPSSSIPAPVLIP